MFASVLAGVAAAPRATERGVLVHPVDVPRLAAATVSRFLAALAARDAPADAVTASFAGRRGHPIWISPARAAELRDAPADHPDGLRGWMRSRGRRVDAVDLADPAVLDDADTPADLEDDP
jgi:nicotine blue oxidoreductase